MGKPSTLRKTNSFYDRDKMPEGYDPAIWHLTLLFEQCAEKYGQDIIGRPIVYTELDHRIHSSGIRSSSTQWQGIVEEMIEYFWDYEVDPDSQYALNDFCNPGTFEYLLEYVLAKRDRDLLLLTGTRTKLRERVFKPSRRSKEEKEVLRIVSTSTTHDFEKVRKFVSESRKSNSIESTDK